MTTPAQRKASAAYHARRRAAGDKLVRVWLTPCDAPTWDTLVAERGSAEKAMTTLLNLYSSTEDLLLRS